MDVLHEVTARSAGPHTFCTARWTARDGSSGVCRFQEGSFSTRNDLYTFAATYFAEKIYQHFTMPSDHAADAKVRNRAIEAFDKLSGGADKMPKTALKKALESVGFGHDHRMQCQALMIIDKSGEIEKDDFVKWCVARVSEGNGAKLNRLLIRYTVGKSRDTSYDLPGEDFTYGVPGGGGTAEPAGKIIFSMPVAQKQAKKEVKMKDIIYENRMANVAGCINTKQANEWRDNYRAKKAVRAKIAKDKFLKLQADEALGLDTEQPSMDEPKRPWGENACFGKVSEPSETVGNLMIGMGVIEDPVYADLSGQTAAGRLPKPRSTNSADLLYKNSRKPANTSVPFKMSKFKNVKAKTINRATRR